MSNKNYMTVESCNIDNLPYVQVQVVEPCLNTDYYWRPTG